jgi:FkbM family methyltransferase
MRPTKYFIEIGSCDFDTLNRLGKKGWGGIIVEPIKRYLDSLERYEHVSYLNAAVDVAPGVRNMNVYKKEVVDKDHDFAGMSSFDEYVIPQNKHLVDKVETVTVTYQDVLNSASIPKVDFLKIDTEGHDRVILEQVIYEGPHRPNLIKVEHCHVKQAFDMASFLEEREYLVFFETRDLYALDARVSPDPFGSHFEVNPNSAQYGKSM